MTCDLCTAPLTERPAMEEQCRRCRIYSRACTDCAIRHTDAGLFPDIVEALRAELNEKHQCRKYEPSDGRVEWR